MANTFKFGNGNWAVKDGYALAYNDENNNFKPLPFDFTRASSATTLNRQGLIETVPSGKPRIDFTDNTDGHLLLEPSRTNIITHSEDFNQWTKLGTTFTITSNNQISPSGELNASTVNVTNNDNILYKSVGSLGSSTSDWNFTIYAKGSGTFDMNIRLNSSTTTTETKTLTSNWQRFNVSVTGTPTINSVESYIEFNTSGTYYIWGAQTEAGSYATSYIPTEGSSVTRVVDDIELTFPDVDSFNSSVGFSVVSKFDIGAAGTGTSAPFLNFNDDTSNTYIGFGSNSANLRCRLNLSGTAYLNTQANAPRTQRNSLFVSCDSSGWSQGANGSTNHTGTNNASVFDRLASISFLPSEVFGIIKISKLLVYNTRLSNTELQNLTS